MWLSSESDDGVWLSRLLQLTRPRPAQAVVVGLGVLCALRALHAAGSAHGSVCADEVRIGSDGQVRLDGCAPGSLGGPVPRALASLDQQQRADLAAAGVLLAHLARAARRSPACTGEGAPALLAALDAAAAEVVRPGAVLELVATLLEGACGPDRDAVARSELATLVQAATVNGSSTGDAVIAVGRVRRQPTATTVKSASGDLLHQRWVTRLGTSVRHWWERMWRWVVALMVLTVAVSLEFVLLHERLTQDLQLLLGADQPGQHGPAPEESSPADLPPVLRPAPASAGDVGSLDLRAVEPCRPAAACAVRVLVRLHPQPVDQQPPLPPRAVRWSFQVIDRCTGSRHSLPGGVVAAAPGDDQVQVVSTVPLPPGQALAVIAMTSEPAKAASGPLTVPAEPGSCSRN